MLLDTVSFEAQLATTFVIGFRRILSIRPFSADGDLLTYYSFIRGGDPGGQEQTIKEALSPMFGFMTRSGSSSAFMVSLDDKPTLEMEIHQAEGYPSVGTQYEAEPGDFIICFASDWERESPTIYAECILNCLTYFSQSGLVGRLLIDDHTLPLTIAQILLTQLPGANLVSFIE